LLDFPPERVKPVGNTALLGAKIALFELGRVDLEYRDIRKRVRHVALNLNPDFQEVFVERMSFPGSSFQT
jgi:uncharacterized 2Fe-2S/4Fe-4S cluster protein (DUF4445 family)